MSFQVWVELEEDDGKVRHLSYENISHWVVGEGCIQLSGDEGGIIPIDKLKLLAFKQVSEDE